MTPSSAPAGALLLSDVGVCGVEGRVSASLPLAGEDDEREEHDVLRRRDDHAHAARLAHQALSVPAAACPVKLQM
jgi:hypothetical protein